MWQKYVFFFFFYEIAPNYDKGCSSKSQFLQYSKEADRSYLPYSFYAKYTFSFQKNLLSIPWVLKEYLN